MRTLVWIAVALAVLGLLMSVAGVVTAEVLRTRPVTLPEPTGRNAVGRVVYDWIDPSRDDPFAPDEGTKRELLVWVWYPATPGSDSHPAPYFPPEWAKVREAGAGKLLFQSFGSVRTHSIAGAPLSAAKPSYPVLIMGPGLGAAAAPDDTVLAEDLASHGYIVVGYTPTCSTDVTFSDGRVVPSVNAARDGAVLDQLLTVWVGDVRFVMDQLVVLNGTASDRFSGRLDLQRIGVFGHSFGRATALEECHLDSRCKAALDIDGSPFGNVIGAGLKQPAMFIIHDGFRPGCDSCEPDSRDVDAILRESTAGGYQVVLKGPQHMNFRDLAMLFAPVMRPLG
jgi:predicted dienelactone hydrolase